MPARSFASTIISELKNAIGQEGNYTKGTPTTANAAIAKAVTTYLLSNTTITVSYKGPIPAGGTEVIPADMLKITGTCAPPSGTDFDSWVKSLESNIISGFFIGPGKLVQPVGVFPCYAKGLSLSRDGDLKGTHEANPENAQVAVWEKICDSILKWLNSTGGTPVFAAKGSVSVGSGQTTKVTVL